ncbi:mediator of RNA polymerase II transcription subunit 12 isoform X1 [Drosophila takahashii]|uniref:mediator of RNA polymerase II transcription subunit 12 isoform X1 n=1 Tax=Drosophila takahashii TaxID=29030 RepID=UPI001CF90B4F|nr:translation initiation factor IF-2 isoform X1 [Drosophila takahashii]
MPPASAVNNSNAAAQAAKAERAEKLRGALKGFIVADRQRRQEEFEAQCEEQRLRREREEVERQNQAALDDTRGQITRLDEQLADLHSQKHQLTVQLKKVLNEDETRKKLAKENELFAIQQAAASAASGPVFLPPLRLQHQHHPLMQKPPPGGQPGKRGRSPSPPSQQQQAYYKSAASYAQQKHDDYRRAADYARLSWNKTTAQYPGTGTVFYQTTAPPPTTQHQADARLQSIYNYNLPLRQAYHVDLPSATASKPPDSQSPKAPQGQPMQVLHINLDQPAISQADLVAQVGGSISVKASQPQVTMEKLPDRYHIEVKHDGQPSHGPPPPHLLSEGVIFKPLLSELSMHTNVLQISSSQFPPQNPKTAGSITQGYAPGRGGSAHEQQLARQQLAMLPGQPGAPTGSVPGSAQQHYTRRMY